MIALVIAFFQTRIGMIVAIALGVFVFYEGVPIAKHLRDIPVIGEPVFAWADPLLRGRVSRARDAGVKAERDEWTRRLAAAKAALSSERATAQAKIDAIVTERLSAATDWAMERASLEAQLAEEEKGNATLPPGTCPPAISRGVSERLDRIGR